MASKHRKTVEVIAYGEEVLYDADKEYSMSELITGLNYYNYNSSHDNLKNYTLEYVAIKRPNDYDILYDLNKTAFKGTTGSMTRMATRGYPFSEKQISQIDDQIDQLIELAKLRIDKPVVVKTTKKTPIDIVGEAISDIDIHIDFCTRQQKFMKFKVIEYIKHKKIKSTFCVEISDYFKDRLATVGDKECFTGKMFEQYTSFLNEIIDAFGANKSVAVVKKERVKKAVDPAKLVAKMKYMKSYSDISSISPTDILGKNRVLLYDTKYNTIQLIISEPGIDLIVRGSTIYNVDKERSIKKIVRKPESFLDEIVSGGNIAHVIMAINNLKTKTTIPSGSVNENVLILRVL